MSVSAQPVKRCGACGEPVGSGTHRIRKLRYGLGPLHPRAPTDTVPDTEAFLVVLVWIFALPTVLVLIVALAQALAG